MTGLPEVAATADEADSAPAAVSVIVCAFTAQRAALLHRCVDAIVAQLTPGDELVVVIDHNEDLRAAVTASRAGGPVRVVPNCQTPGLSAARNTGIAESGCDIVAFVDDDARIDPGWLDRIRDGYRATGVVGFGGFARPAWPRHRPGWFPEEFDWVVGCSHRGVPTTPAPVRNLLGCNMSFRRSALQTSGGFSTGLGRVGTLPSGCEETELCIRLRRDVRRSQIVFDPGLVVQHHVSPNRTRLGYFIRRCWGEGRSKYLVGTMVGSGDALSAEWSYVVRVLPAGVLRALAGALRGPRRIDHLGRAAVLVLGLTVTTLGYGRALLGGVPP